MSKKYDVLIQPFDYDKDRIYITFGYNFGFSLKHYQISDEIYQINPASILFLTFFKNKFSKEKLGKNIDISVNSGNTTISFVSTSKKITEDLKKLNQLLLYSPEDNFEDKKREFIEVYSKKENQFPDIFNLSILEFIGQNKRFSRYELFNQIQKVTLEEVRYTQINLFEAMEAKLFILGNVDKDIGQLLKHTISSPREQYRCKSVFFPLNDSDIVPKEILIKENGKRDLLIHTNPIYIEGEKELSISLEEVFMVYQILVENYKEFHPIMSIDGADLGMYIPKINKIEKSLFNEEILTQYIEQIKQQRNYLLQERPNLYAKLLVVLWLSRINYLKYNSEVITQSIETIRNKFSIVLDNSLFCTVNSK